MAVAEPVVNGAKAKDPATLSVQSRVEKESFAPGVSGDVGAGAPGLFWINLGHVADEAPEWNPLFPNLRDRYLRAFSRQEPMLASGLYNMKTRVQSLNYTLNGPPRAKKFAQGLLDAPMGGYSNLLAEVGKFVDDLESADNGAFMELWRPGRPDTDAKDRPVMGFAQLDSRQCWRSYDPEFPVWYSNPVTGQMHKLHRTRVVMTADNVQPVEIARGIGFCGVSRALRMSRIMRNTLIYRDEKVSGRFTRAIGAVKGVTSAQLKAALSEHAEEQDNRGFLVYKNIPFLTAPGNDVADIDIILKDLASIPDGFNFESDVNLYAYILAFCFGVDAREFWPATQSGATKADASVQNMKARGRGLGVIIETLEWVLRQCLPDTVTFEYDFTDDDQDLQQAQIHQVESNNLKIAQDSGWINNIEGRALAIAKGILDGDVLDAVGQPVTSDDNPNAQPAETPVQTQNADNPQDPAQPAEDNPQDQQPGGVNSKAFLATPTPV